MRIYRDLDMVEQLGSGIPRILQTYGEYCFHFTDSYTRMIFPAELISISGEKVGEKVGENLTENQKTILQCIKQNSNISVIKISEIVGISPRKVEENISKLKEIGYIKRIGPAKGGPWQILLDDK